MNYALGVDLGTTFSAAAIWDRSRGAAAQALSLGNGSFQIPSVLYREPDGTFLVGDAAERRSLIDSANVVREFKRRLGDVVPILVGGTPYSPQLLTAQLLRWIFDETTGRMGRSPDEVILTHPAGWADFKIDLLHQAALLADIGVVRTCPEPVAAALEYARAHSIEVGGRICVFDLGGGTFDVAVLERTEGGFAVLGVPTGVENLGGVDFDHTILTAVVNDLQLRIGSLDLADPALDSSLVRLRRDCVEAKEALSADVDAVIMANLAGREISFRLTRPEFEDTIRPVVLESVDSMKRALSSARTAAQELSAIVLVGGSSKIPLVAEMLIETFQRPVVCSTNPKNDVALGATYSGSRAAVDARGSSHQRSDPDQPTTITPTLAEPNRAARRKYRVADHALDTPPIGIRAGADPARAPLPSDPRSDHAVGVAGLPPTPRSKPAAEPGLQPGSGLDQDDPAPDRPLRMHDQHDQARLRRAYARPLAIATGVTVILGGLTAYNVGQSNGSPSAGPTAVIQQVMPSSGRPAASAPATRAQVRRADTPRTIRVTVGAATASSKVTSTAPPTSSGEAAEWLQNRATGDRQQAERHLDEWIVIVSSKQVGTGDPLDLLYPGVPYDNPMIVQNFRYWLQRFPDALLADSGAYSSHHAGWWMTLIPRPHATPEQANEWCRQQELTPNDCHATRISHTLEPGPETSVSWVE